jgi:3-oxoacyl-[acyl-carrier-protein] synthase II
VTAVAVTGIGVLSAFGVGTDRFWDGLRSGRCPFVKSPEGLPLGAVDGLELREFVRTPAGRRIDHASLLALAAARLALADAGLGEDALDPVRTGLVLGSSLGNLRETAPFLDRLFERGAGNPLVFPNMVMNAPLSYVSIELGISGLTAMTTDAEVSGEAAVAWGARLIADGAADRCLVGATDEIADILIAVLDESGGLTRDTARPLDRAADGRVLGEGAAVFVLEAREQAHARGARAYCEIVPHAGFSVRSPIHGYPRDPAEIARRLGALAADVELVVAAASGLPALDACEARMLAALVGDRVPVVAPRGALGDFGAAGALAVAAAALALHHGEVPPTVGCRPPAREGLDVVVGSPRRCRPRAAMVSGLGRGGVCRPVCLVRSGG